MPIARRLARVLILLALTVSGGRACAQEIAFRHYGPAEGLDNTGINCLTQAADGVLYVCTQSGARRYDGSGFVNVADGRNGLPADGLVRDVRMTRDGRLWIVFIDSIYVEAAGADRFVQVDTGPVPIEIDAGDTVADPSADPGTGLGTDSGAGAGGLLFTSAGQLFRVEDASGRPRAVAVFDAPTLARLPVLSDVHAVASFGGSVWLGCGGAICRLGRGGTVRVVGAADGLPSASWQAFALGPDGILWSRSPARLASIATGPDGSQPGSPRVSTVPIPGGVGRYDGTDVRLSLALDARGRPVTPTASGIGAFDGTGWQVYSHERGVPPGMITALMFDREGSLWLAARGLGAFRAAGFGSIENWTRASGLASDVIWSMLRVPSGPLLVAGDEGLSAIAPPADRAAGGAGPHLPDATGETYTLAVTQAGRVLIAPFQGALTRFDPRDGRSVGLGAYGVIEALLTGRDGALWVGARGGLWRIARPDAPDVRDYGVASILPGERIRGIAQDTGGGLWVLGRSSLYHREAGGGDPRTGWRQVTGTRVAQGAAMLAVSAGAPGTVWIGGIPGGLQRLDWRRGAIRSIEAIGPPQVGSRNVVAILQDRVGRVWVGTDRGLDILEGRTWRHVGTANGLVSNDVDQGALYEDADGTVWVGTSQGLSHVIDLDGAIGHPGLHPVISGIAYGDRTLPLRDRIALKTGERPVVVAFGALDFRDADGLRFRYRLRGIDQDWVDTTERSVRFASLPAGRVRFELEQVDTLDGRVSAPVSVTFDVRPAWWRHWYVDAAAAALLLGLLALVLRLRDHMHLARRRLLEREVGERTAEIESARRTLLRAATIDSLTGLLNRGTVLEALRSEIAAAVRDGEALAIVLIDLDHFKRINDLHGHLAGDGVLREVGLRLSGLIRSTDIAGRYGGEELLVILPGVREGQQVVIRTICRAFVEEPCIVEGVTLKISASAGAAFHQPGEDETSLIRRADAALYRAKNAGRARIEFAAAPPDLSSYRRRRS